jgi:aspartate/methionine/tyrosine aminotransferase
MKMVGRAAVNGDIAPFHAIVISTLAHALQGEGRSVIRMEFGQPSTGAPKGAIAAAHRILDSDPMGYWESIPLKERLSQHYRETYGLEIPRDRFILTSGASAALVLALLTSFSPGDQIAFARPGYVAYRNTVRALHMVPVEIPSGPQSRFQLTAEAIASLEKPPKGLIVASPANPTGTILSPAGLSDIAAVCKRLSIQIISDEIYHGLSYTIPTRSMLEFDTSAHVINSFSKLFCMPGWRLGWLLASQEQLRRARSLVGNLFLSAPSLSQHAALAAFDDKDELQAHLQTYRQNRELLLAALPKLGLPIVAPPDGAFYMYVDVGHLTNNSLEFCKELLQQTGVAIAPGIDFDPVEGNRFIRISFAVSVQETQTAIDRLTAWLSTRKL